MESEKDRILEIAAEQDRLIAEEAEGRRLNIERAEERMRALKDWYVAAKVEFKDLSSPRVSFYYDDQKLLTLSCDGIGPIRADASNGFYIGTFGPYSEVDWYSPEKIREHLRAAIASEWRNRDPQSDAAEQSSSGTVGCFFFLFVVLIFIAGIVALVMKQGWGATLS